MATKLQTLIETTEDINFLIEDSGGYETGFDVTFAQSSNKNPSPAGRLFTSSTQTESDVININGWVRELKCGVVVIDTTDYLTRLKKTVEAQKYTVAEMARITNADGVFDNMLLKSVTWRRAGDSPQEALISMTWESANLAGTIDNPNFVIGGLTG